MSEDRIAVVGIGLRDQGADSSDDLHGNACAGARQLRRPQRGHARFVDRVLAHEPGAELVVETELSADSDPYLADYAPEGVPLLPPALGMEAMAQVAAAVSGRTGVPLLEDVRFLRPVAVGGVTAIRLTARVLDADTVEVVLSGADTRVDHLRARLSHRRPATPAYEPAEALALPAVPAHELYGGILQHGKRFQRLLAYRRAGSRHAVAELATTATAPWFAAPLPQGLTLADPGTRDAVLHAVQGCVPDATLAPQAVERLHLAHRQDTEYVVVDARERTQDGDIHTYDVDVLSPSGTVVERWEGLTLRAVPRADPAGPWPPALLGAHVERSLARVLGGRTAIAVERDPATAAGPVARRAQTTLAASRAVGRPVRVRHRPDGKPEIDGGTVSASHAAGLTLVAAGAKPLGCDLEVVRERSAQAWADLLGPHQVPVRDLLAVEAGESRSVAGTRVWSALECLRKTGSTTQALTVDRIGPRGWAVLSTGDARIATWVTAIAGIPEPVVVAVLSGEE